MALKLLLHALNFDQSKASLFAFNKLLVSSKTVQDASELSLKSLPECIEELLPA